MSMLNFVPRARQQQRTQQDPPPLINIDHHIRHHIQTKTREQVGEYIEGIHSIYHDKPKGSGLVDATVACHREILTKGNTSGDGVPLFLVNAGNRLELAFLGDFAPQDDDDVNIPARSPWKAMCSSIE